MILPTLQGCRLGAFFFCATETDALFHFPTPKCTEAQGLPGLRVVLRSVCGDHLSLPLDEAAPVPHL